MKKKLRTLFLALAAAICFVLMAAGTLIALPLAMLGVIGLNAGLWELEWALAGFALFGLTTVALCSVCCFGGLLYVLNACLDSLSGTPFPMERPLILMTLLSLCATAAIFPATRWDEWFMPVCIVADIVHALSIILYIRAKRGNSHDPNRP